MNKSLRIKRIVGVSILLALTIVLQLFSNYIQISVSITLALTPVIIGSILYGPLIGMFLGGVMGIIVFFAPSTISSFWPITVFGTLIVCVLKSAIAGFVSGLVFSKLHKKNMKIAVATSSILVPIINTGLFIFSGCTVFASLYFENASAAGNVLIIYIIGQILVNFILELLVNALLSPTVLYLVNIASNNYNLGTNLNKKW